MKLNLKDFAVFSCILLCAGVARAAEEYQPIKAGSFLLSPKLILEQNYSDNIYATDGNEESDFISVAKPSLKIEKSIRDHEFKWENSAEIFQYRGNSDENRMNYKSELSGKLVARRVLTLPFKLSYGVNHNERRYERSSMTREPTQYQQLKSEIGALYKPGRLGIGVYGGYNQTRYDNGTSFAGAPVIREDGDYDTIYLKTEAEFTTRTELTPFVSLLVSENDFLRRTFDGTGFNGVARDNRLMQALTGARFEYHDMLEGSAAFGHDWRRYDDDAVEDVTALSAQGSLSWWPVMKTKLMLDFLRQSEEDNVVDDGTVETRVTFGLDYELKNDLFLKSMTEWEGTEFENLNRSDDIYAGSIGFSYVLNRKLEVGASYLHRFRESTQIGSDFSENVFLLRLTGKL